MSEDIWFLRLEKIKELSVLLHLLENVSDKIQEDSVYQSVIEVLPIKFQELIDVE